MSRTNNQAGRFRTIGTLLAAAAALAIVSTGCGMRVSGSLGVHASADVSADAAYEPQLYNGYVVYYDAGARPYYYVNGTKTWVPRTYANYNVLVTNYRTHHVRYRTWRQRHGVRMRTYRHPTIRFRTRVVRVAHRRPIRRTTGRVVVRRPVRRVVVRGPVRRVVRPAVRIRVGVPKPVIRVRTPAIRGRVHIRGGAVRGRVHVRGPVIRGRVHVRKPAVRVRVRVPAVRIRVKTPLIRGRISIGAKKRVVRRKVVRRKVKGR